MDAIDDLDVAAGVAPASRGQRADGTAASRASSIARGQAGWWPVRTRWSGKGHGSSERASCASGAGTSTFVWSFRRGHRAEQRGDDEAAELHFRAAAERGDAHAAFHVALAHE